MLTRVAPLDENGHLDKYDLETMTLCAAHFLPRWADGEVEIVECNIPETEADCDDCQFEKVLANFLAE